ncbi:hypothetical protein CPB84DRAFT_1852221 [Gymnopilus junonius]|uniref:Uncharacterized protein n=1 Tax=Gymnopilus junonius TaxID=109634 RepID=A0A9P5NCZ3_GYMJU|nr:hypothetical protein CPB84DRAFT_1852221 [Gymnopilus junonius]
MQGNMKGKVAKPPGKAGRKNCGGFNLEKALGWDEEKYNMLTKCVNELATEKLDVKKCFSKQKPEIVQNVIQIVMRKLKIFDVYVSDWPVHEALKLRLKYTSEIARKQAK